jgi:hypothetical protein
MTEQEILDKYSNSSLRRNQLTRQAKKEHLQNPKYALTVDEIEKLLDDLYENK